MMGVKRRRTGSFILAVDVDWLRVCDYVTESSRG
jgi:hypothetical protein